MTARSEIINLSSIFPMCQKMKKKMRWNSLASREISVSRYAVIVNLYRFGLF